jgi:hypothetical protein
MGNTYEKSQLTFADQMENLSDKLGIRPVAALVFLTSVMVLVYLHGLTKYELEAPAVAVSEVYEHPALTDSFIEEVFVRSGDVITEGAPIAHLSSQFLDRELVLINSEINRLQQQSIWRIAQTELNLENDQRDLRENLVNAERLINLAGIREGYSEQMQSIARERENLIEQRVAEQLTVLDDLEEAQLNSASEAAQTRLEERRVVAEESYRESLNLLIQDNTDGDALNTALSGYVDAQLQLVQRQKEEIIQGINNLTIHARESGRVLTVLPQGSAVSRGTSVATIVREQPEEVVAFFSPSSTSDNFLLGAEVRITGPQFFCSEMGQVLRLGGSVQEAPGQLSNLLGITSFGLPVHISVPENCPLIPGQAVTVQLIN